jgi:hypothetical protein
MKQIIITYGIGYGRHEMDLEVEDDATDEDIEVYAQDAVMERLDWGWKVDA